MKQILVLAFLGSSVVFPQSAGAVSTVCNYNFPATAGTAGQIATSGGGGTSPNTWTSITGTPTAAVIQLSRIYTVSTLPTRNSTANSTESAISDARTPGYLGTLTVAY